MNNNNNSPKAILHGECLVFESVIPSDAILETNNDGQTVIIAPSETTGNHHVIRNSPNVRFYHNSDKSRRFVSSKDPISVECVIKERHDKIELPAGDYEIGFQQEFDYLAMQQQQVRD